jgi:TolB protein
VRNVLGRVPGAGSAGPSGRAWRAVTLSMVLLLLVAAGCSAKKGASPPPLPGASIPIPSPTPPLPAPTGAPITATLATTPHFLMSLAGDLSQYTNTRIVGVNLDLPQAEAVMAGAPENPADSIYAPEISHDRTKVVYVEATSTALNSPDNDGGGDVVVQNIDGSGAKVVASGDNVSPTWSPDGKQIAFVRGGALWLMNADGSNPHALGVNLSVSYYLAWSPDGSRIAVAAGQPSQIQVIDLATLAMTPVGNAAEEDGPAWSPDGKDIVFTEGATDSLYVASVTSGADVRELTNCVLPCQRDLEPAWSPDGGTIVFVRYTPNGGQGGSEQLWQVPAAGGDAHELTSGPEEHAFPSW